MKQVSSFNVGDFVSYFSKPSMKRRDKEGKTLSRTEQCVWIEVNGEKKTRRHKKNVKLHTI
eukprot:15265403-Ditylum_brightwellii.AAC.1